MKRVRVSWPDFEAAFETDGVVRRADPAIDYLVGWTDDEAREFVWSKGWKASIVAGAPIRVIQHWESFEVHRDGKRKQILLRHQRVPARRLREGRQGDRAATGAGVRGPWRGCNRD